ncbi:efflux RND transporter periplasmic adaptor subunit [Oceaniserpentilla sp. 4NH20-0058]|uniref:efflux RND transporter periplasmic adaptor subunit n=1 Tax=Oceaniserpentilla sp. 4NH20-0058 TaxID=3127660 RepID=UPI003107BEE5
MLRKLAFGVLILIIAAVVWRYYHNTQTQPRAQRAAPVVLFEVQPSQIKASLEALGSARAAESVTLTASVTEKVSNIHFKQGQFVQKGETLITLANEEELAQLSIAKIELAEQQREYKRIEKLVKQKSVSASELDRLQSSIDTARGRIAQVQATLKDRVIKAPFDGLLGLRNISVGTLLKPGDEITTLDSVDHLEMDFDLAEIYLPRIKVGQVLDAHSVAYPEHIFKGEIVTLDSRVNPSTRNIKVRAKIDNPQRLLRPGMLLTLDIINQQRTSLMLPEEAVFMRADQHLVYKITDHMVAKEQQIEIGLRQNGKVEVIKGLKQGDNIVWQGLLKVKPGAKVKTQVESWRGDKT